MTGAPGILGARLDPKDGSWSAKIEAGFVYVPLSELNRWLPPTGSPALHKAFHVRARDGAGNWTTCADGFVDLDRTSPVITAPLQVDISAPGEAALARTSARARNILGVRLSAKDPQGISAAEFFDGTDPGQGKGTALRATDGALDETAEQVAATTSVKRWTPGVHTIKARVRDTAGNWSTIVAARVNVTFPRIFGDGFEAGKLRHWSRVGGRRVTVTPAAKIHGRYGLRIATGRKAAYLADTSPSKATSYRASFSIATGTSSTGGAWQTVFAAVDRHGKTALAVQRRTGASGGQVVRLVTLRHGRAVELSQTLLSAKRHAVSVAWFGANNGEAGLWIDGRLVASVTKLANAGQTIESARLGQVGGGNSHTRGNLIVDDFDSTT